MMTFDSIVTTSTRMLCQYPSVNRWQIIPKGSWSHITPLNVIVQICYLIMLIYIVLYSFILTLNIVQYYSSRYPDYHFVSDHEISKSAGLNERYSDKSLHGVIFDIHMLSECNFIVCTFSSQVKQYIAQVYTL